MAFKFISNEATRVYAKSLIYFFCHLECCLNRKEFIVSNCSIEISIGISPPGHLFTYASSRYAKAKSEGRG